MPGALMPDDLPSFPPVLRRARAGLVVGWGDGSGGAPWDGRCSRRCGLHARGRREGARLDPDDRVRRAVAGAKQAAGTTGAAWPPKRIDTGCWGVRVTIFPLRSPPLRMN